MWREELASSKKTTLSTISTGRLNTLLCVHRPPINLMVYKGCQSPCGDTISNLGGGFPLRCFQRLSVGNLVTQRCRKISTTGTPGIPSSQSSRTRDESPQISAVVLDRDRAVLRRSEPSSRTALTGEQPDPWELLHPQDAMSRHRDSPTGECTLLLPRGLTIPSSFQSRKELVFYRSYKFCPCQTRTRTSIRACLIPDSSRYGVA